MTFFGYFQLPYIWVPGYPQRDLRGLLVASVELLEKSPISL